MDMSALNPLNWGSAPFIILIALALLIRRRLGTPHNRWQRVTSETLAVGPAVLLYFLVRGFVDARREIAVANAQRIIDVEESLGIHVEQQLQELVLDSDRLVTAFNWIYIWTHWPVITVVIIWLVLCRQDEYVRYRNALLLSGALGMIMFAAFPVAPPRLMDNLAVVDTVTERSHSYRVLQPPGLTNPYAAMPSLHFGWNLLMGIAIFEQSRRMWAKGFGIVMPLAMYFAIILTANHYLLDGVAGGLLVLVSLAIVSRPVWSSRKQAETGTRHEATARAPSTPHATLPGRRPLIVAHRHGNTLEGLRRAETAGADIVEADVWLYRGNLEVRHTKTLGPVPILWDRWSIEPASTPRLQLADLLAATGNDTLLMLDLKGRDRKISEAVIHELETHLPGKPVLVCSQNWALLEPFRSYPPAVLVNSIGNRWQLRRAWRHLETMGFDAISIQYRLLSGHTVMKLRQRTSLILTWPINTEARLRQVVEWKLDGAIVDDLDIATMIERRRVRDPATAEI